MEKQGYYLLSQSRSFGFQTTEAGASAERGAAIGTAAGAVFSMIGGYFGNDAGEGIYDYFVK